MPPRPKTIRIRKYIVENLADHPSDIANVTAARFGMTRQGVLRHLRALELAGVIESDGRTRGKRYQLKNHTDTLFVYDADGLQEDIPWANDVKPLLGEVRKNVFDICSYGFTEILNNAIEHSGTAHIRVAIRANAEAITIEVDDDGVGIFNKIRSQLDLPDELSAVPALATGKLTTDPSNHSGEGIFFTSRLFDHFWILSGSLFFSHTRTENDWLIEDQDDPIQGTRVVMTIGQNTTTDIRRVFDLFASGDDLGFSKTIVPVQLHQYGADSLVSRSQARRMLSRFDAFKEIVLDFSRVPSIGQGFADEVFRVYASRHPDKRLAVMHATEDVQRMVGHAIAAGS